MRDLLVDGNNLTKRVWKGMPELNTSTGKPVHVIFGVLKILRAAIERFDCHRVFVTWDGHPAMRKLIFPEYKIKREQARQQYTEEEQQAYQAFKAQVNELRELLPQFGVIQVYEPQTEADDLISVLASNSDKAVILSEDQDFIQLVSSSVQLFRPISNKLYTIETLEELTGLATVQQFLQYRIITGDESDEIPGVGGFKKRAHDLIKEHVSIQNILSKPELNKGKVMEKFFASKEVFIRNTLLMDLSLSEHYLGKAIESCCYFGKYDEALVKKILVKHEFISILRSLKEFCRGFQTLSN